MVESCGTSDSPQRAMVRAAARVLADCGYYRTHTVNDLEPADAMAATAAMLRATADPVRWEFITETRNPDDLFEGLAKSLEGDDEALARVADDSACEYGEYILTQALETLPTADELARDRHVDQQIDQMKLA